MPKLITHQQKIRGYFASLVKQDKNHELYKAIISHPNKHDINSEAMLIPTSGYRLLRIDERLCSKDEGFEIALINEHEESVVYYNKVVITEYCDLNCRPATQSLVWRSPSIQHKKVLRGVASDVFFKYILNRYDAILSDCYQTGAGQHFWQEQLSAAIAYNFFTYYYKMLEGKLIRLNTENELNELADEIWGDDEEYKYHLAIISKFELPLDTKVVEE